MPIRCVSLLLTLLLWAACRSAPAEPPPPPTLAPTPLVETVTVGVATSASAVATLTPADAVPGAALRWVQTSAGALPADLTAGNLDALLLHVPPADGGYYINPIAVDALIVIVHPDNPITALTLQEVRALFSGETATWDVPGGAARPVVPVIRERGSGARELFNQRVLGAQRAAIGARVALDPAAVQQAVAAEPGAIGYVTLGSLAAGEGAPAVRALALNGIAATPATAADQSYPLSVPIYWVSLGEPQGAARALLAYWQSAAGQAQLGQRLGRVVP